MSLPIAHLTGTSGPLEQRLPEPAHGVELDPARAQRTVSAGQGSHLEAQIVGRSASPGSGGSESAEGEPGVPAG